MHQQFLSKMLLVIARFGANPDDSDEIRLQKIIMVVATIGGLNVIILWGVVYWLFNEMQAVALLVVQGVLTLLSFLLFGLKRQTVRTFYLGQAIIIFVMPFLIMLTLGGIVNSSLMIAWPLLAPMAMLIVSTTSEATLWFIGYVVLIILSILFQPYLRLENNLPPAVQSTFWGMNLITPSSFVFLTLQYFVSQKNRFFQLLRHEQEKSESLLLNVLPKEIAIILKDEKRTIADHFDGVSILFADVVNFTPMSSTMTPLELVELLNEIFSHFDSLVEKYGLEKIKTIGDCYMVASGVPRSRPDHAYILTHMALEMSNYVSQREFHGRKLAFRIGINSGPVVAGVIGRKKFIYDLWGDAVNTASRMESHGASGCIQITEATYDLIQDDFICEAQGTILIKGKGEMKVWYVIGQKT
jgi:guanylate cyclase